MGGGNEGFCPYPPTANLTQFSTLMRSLYFEMEYCHTDDRDNLLAFGECGHQGFNNEKWQEAVNLELYINYYASFQTEADKLCMQNFHPRSLKNYLKTYEEYDSYLSNAHNLVISSLATASLLFLVL